MAAEDAMNDLLGKAKEVGGKLTGDDRLEAEGKADQLQAQISEKVEEAKETLSQGINQAKDALKGVKDSFKQD